MFTAPSSAATFPAQKVENSAEPVLPDRLLKNQQPGVILNFFRKSNYTRSDGSSFACLLSWRAKTKQLRVDASFFKQHVKVRHNRHSDDKV